MQHVQIPPLDLLAIVLTVIEVTVSMNVRIEMNVPKKVTLVTLMPLVRIPMEATIVNATRDGEVMVSAVPISMNVRKKLITAMGWQGV